MEIISIRIQDHIQYARNMQLGLPTIPYPNPLVSIAMSCIVLLFTQFTPFLIENDSSFSLQFKRRVFWCWLDGLNRTELDSTCHYITLAVENQQLQEDMKQEEKRKFQFRVIGSVQSFHLLVCFIHIQWVALLSGLCVSVNLMKFLSTYLHQWNRFITAFRRCYVIIDFIICLIDDDDDDCMHAQLMAFCLDDKDSFFVLVNDGFGFFC